MSIRAKPSRPTRRRNGPTKPRCALNVRPRVVVYVTREHPETGADELLVFDLPDEPGVADVVPGGRLEPGESPEETAVREVAEETGLEIRPLRRLGVLEQASWRIPGLRDENHFIHAVPIRRTEAEWDHVVKNDAGETGCIHCRWVPVHAGMSVYGAHGVFLDAILRKRVVGFVTRERNGRTELLVFDFAGQTELPGGRIDAHESLEEGLIREIEEETGVTGVRVLSELADPAEFTRLFGPGVHGTHVFHAVTETDARDAWEHQVTGTGMDASLVYPCRWVPLDECPPLWGKPDPFVEKLRLSITDR